MIYMLTFGNNIYMNNLKNHLKKYIFITIYILEIYFPEFIIIYYHNKN